MYKGERPKFTFKSMGVKFLKENRKTADNK